MKQSAGRLQFIYNWIIGETRILPLWQGKLAVISPLTTSSRPQKECFPVVIFSHGLSGCRHFYSTYCASLASNGFVVAAVEHSDYSACWTYKLIADSVSGRMKERHYPIRIVDGDDKRLYKIRNQQLNKRVSECVKALHVLEEITLGQLQGDNIAVGKEFDWSMFRGRMDLTRAFIAGHSFGGATSIAATAFSTDFQSAVVLDGWFYPLEPGHYERATQPTLFLNAGKWQSPENIGRIYKLRNISEKLIYTFTDAEHQNFTDFPFLFNSYIGKRMRLHGDIPPDVTMEAIVEMTVAFFCREQGQESREPRHLVDEKYSRFVVEGCPSHPMNPKPG
ncbi:Platelet-activating factor acetylhydrolase plasma/intracellular isoform II [Trichostrongylus colubriformis]|uniref:1-alkyl-2-acetylglycerophosphocholine esterase n=1 Tax=Trichostrongylus colubriformis TaxID=6319 RepID=A0AAN8INM7_TRICO